jgi:hypothetical protein
MCTVSFLEFLLFYLYFCFSFKKFTHPFYFIQFLLKFTPSQFRRYNFCQPTSDSSSLSKPTVRTSLVQSMPGFTFSNLIENTYCFPCCLNYNTCHWFNFTFCLGIATYVPSTVQVSNLSVLWIRIRSDRHHFAGSGGPDRHQVGSA